MGPDNTLNDLLQMKSQFGFSGIPITGEWYWLNSYVFIDTGFLGRILLTLN